MSFQIRLSIQAESDLRSIYDYIAFELQSPMNALGQINRLEKHIGWLADFPESHPLYDKEPWKSRGLRVLYVDKYIVFYILATAKQEVTVIRIMYGRRDVDKQLHRYSE